MHDQLRIALAPVLADLAVTGGPKPDVRDDDWAGDPASATAMLWGDGHGAGVRVTLDAPPAAQVAEVADGVQEWAVEELWSLGRPTNWPPCPAHPRTHPLTSIPEGTRAVWRCPVADRSIAPIGALVAQTGGRSS